MPSSLLCLLRQWWSSRFSIQTAAPPKIWHCVLYAFSGGVFSASLYYSNPMLNVLAREFHVGNTEVANIPTLAQAGDVTGLLLIIPLADFFPRKSFLLTMLCLCTLFWIGLCFARDFNVFLTLTFLSAIFSGAVQVFLVLVTEMSEQGNKAMNLAIVASGPTMGILLARIIAGIVAQYVSWRYVYILALCLQSLVVLLLFLLMPAIQRASAQEQPVSVKKLVKLYPSYIASIPVVYFKHPVLLQASLLSACTFFVVASFWTTLTFFLSDAYHYQPLPIGLFGLAGISTVFLGPIYARYIITPIDVPLLSAALGIVISSLATVIGMTTGKLSVVGLVVQALGIESGITILQVSNRIAIGGLNPLRGNQINTAFVTMLYVGMVCGTKAGTEIYQKYGGWIPTEGLSIAVLVLSLALVLLRGPNETRWIEWKDGWRSSREAAP